MNLPENFRRDLDELLILTDPLFINTNTSVTETVSLSNIDQTNSQDLLTLNLKPSLKLDKKIKKIDKDEDRDTDRTGIKLKIKKKIKSKVSFEEEYDVNEELTEIETTESIAVLSIARPAKPVTITPTFQVKQKASSTPNSKKKSSSLGGQKKLDQNLTIEKPKEVTILKPLTVQDLADLFKISKTEIIKALFLKGINITINQTIDINTAQNIGKDFSIEVQTSTTNNEISLKRAEINLDINIGENRPPIVTIMGHVDHGKTSLLDKIRNTQIAKKEAGGITQKIGAYEVNIDYKGKNKTIVFLDTPGHAAFSGMRSRGVSITDLVVLVVAADDGIKPQTVEAIEYCQAARVPLIVAVNKMDKEDADINKIQQDLSKYNIIPEEWGGDTIIVPISAIQGTNIDKLLESIVLIAEVMNIRANSTNLAVGMVLESNIDRSKGPVATLIIQNGTLKVGDMITSSNSVSKVRGMMDSTGKQIKEAPPSSPVLVWGLSKLLSIGDPFTTFKTEKEAKLAMEKDTAFISGVGANSIQQFTERYDSLKSEQTEKLNFIIKTDTQGSAEAIISTINKISSPKVQIKILYASAGEITETDIEFASATQAMILAFNTTSASGTKKAAKYSSITIKEFNVIYDLFDYIEEAMEKIAGPEYEETFIGTAIVKTVFPLAKSFVAGSAVIEGKITRGSFIHVVRGEEVVYKGNIDSLKKVKEDVLEVTENVECGIYSTKFDTWKTGDLIKAFEIHEKKNTHSKK
jgi:translation initiation factor IF-2